MTRATRPGLGGRGPRGDRAGVERAVVWLVALAVVAGVVGSVWFLAGDLRRDVPESEFRVDLDADTGTLVVSHAGGDAIRDRGTKFLDVVVVDGETGASARVTWAGETAPRSRRGTGFPVERGSSIRVDDPTVDADGDGSVLDETVSVGFELSADDEVRVVWRGSRRTGTAQTVTLANVTAG